MEEEYEMSDSEDDYSKEDKLLLEDARNAMRQKEISSDEEVYGFGESDSDGEDEGNDIDMGSDLEDEEKLPDDRAWGKRKRSFYSTDFVDQDYDGVYQGEEAEIAELEEQEARNIQKRLVEQLNDADFSITDAINIADAAEGTTKDEVIQSDLSKLTKRQKLDLVKKESPEFFVLVEDFKEKMEEAQTLLPVIEYFQKRVKTSFPALEFLQTRLSLILNYCTNISFYLLLKSKRISVKNHPILKSLFRYRQLLEQMEEVDKKVVKPQLGEILEMIKSGKEINIDKKSLEENKKTTLKVLSKRKEKKKMEMEEVKEEVQDEEEEMEIKEEEEEEEEEKEMNVGGEKRAITYEMAKNKGLIPKRSKEQRNPRVKHRRKYEKAKIRRRGQVRTPRAEIPVYGGEPTGIKIGLTKSIKLKY